MDVGALLRERRSIRGFRPEPLPRAALDALFAAAQRAPSWCNIQPWRVTVTAPPLTAEVAAALVDAASTGPKTPDIPFPPAYPEPYLGHRRACGFALHGAMGIGRGDTAGREAAWRRNYALFGAPHLAVVGRDRRLGEYATLDVGIWLGTLLTAAAAMGIATCPMASIAAYPAPLRHLLGIPEEEVVLVGIALGREDDGAVANLCRTDRDPVERNVRFLGF
jgi:nitroreductase